MKKWAFPDEAGYGMNFHYVCFNDACKYFVEGWSWMQEKYNVRSSYRHRLNPTTGECGPLAVWSPQALKSRIIDAEQVVE